MHRQAVLYEPESTASQTVMVSLDSSGLKIESADRPQQVHSRERLAVPEYIPGVPLTVRLPNGQSLEIPDGQFARRLATKTGRTLEMFERHLLLLVALLLAAFLVPYAFHKLALPQLAPKITERLPAEKISQIGEEVFTQLSQAGFFEVLEAEQHLQQQNLLSDLGERLLEDLDSEFSYRFMLISGERWKANAFALPGGQIMVTDELAEMLDEDELAAVLAHEIAHVELRHPMNALIRNSIFGAFLLLMLGDIWSVILPSTISDMAYSRVDELAADCQAAGYLNAAGMNPQLIGSALEKLIADNPGGKLLSYLSTHPHLDQRLENVADCVAAVAQ